MSVTTEKTVRELALENSTVTRVFEELCIDYCCGGNKSLEEACRAAKLPVEQVLDALEIADPIGPGLPNHPRLAGRAPR